MKYKTHEQLEQMHGKPISQILIEAYQEHGNQKKVAQSLGVAQSTISLWMRFAKLKLKTVVVEEDASTLCNKR